ncbi:hypothetical protein OEZ86_012176 [Tetradesmus obliquus]|nr:hypothetical protein OEZ86_012176 [Tetradesmus obliquus]
MQFYGRQKGVRSLAQQLDADPDFGVDVNNSALLFACEGLAVSSSTARRTARRARTRAATAAAAAPYEPDPDASQAFSLASRPSSSKKIWLDFKGCNITGTAWNSKKSKLITIPPYDKDGKPAEFNSEEMSDIVAIWRAVAEDYAPFDVDVTTIPPGPSISVVNVSHACIGGDGAGVSQGAGGISYTNVFGKSYNAQYQPALIFPKNLGPDNPKFVWEATSHEVGHNMGLNHDGNAATAYYRGQGDWAPIMGLAYDRPLSQWSKGEYAGVNNKEDDTVIITAKLGLVTSLIGNSPQTATPLDGFVASALDGTVSTSATGIVTQPGVAHFFTFYAAAGTAIFTGQVLGDWTKPLIVTEWPQRSNLDMLITVFNSAGQQIAAINPNASITTGGGSSATTLGVAAGTAAATVALPSPGWYYVSLAGTGPSPLSAMAVSAELSASSPFKSGNGYRCTATVTVTSSASGTAVSGAAVNLTWTLLGTASPPTSATTLSDGVATSTSNKYSTAVPAGSCGFAVTSVAATGFTTFITRIQKP